MTVSVRSLLPQLGFVEDWTAPTDEQPALRFDFGNLTLTAAQRVNRWLQPVWTFGGVANDGRTIALVEFEMPLEVESREQGVAWIAQHVNGTADLLRVPDWLHYGHAWRDELPWRKKLRVYENRQRCSVERDWFRLPCKTIRELGEAAGRDDHAEVFSMAKFSSCVRAPVPW